MGSQARKGFSGGAADARLLTPTELGIAQKAARDFSFQPTSGQVLVGGRINDTWRVDTPQGSYVLRLYPKGRRLKQIVFELDVLEHLARSGCRVPRPIVADCPTAKEAPNETPLGAPQRVDERPFAWFEFIDGEPLSSAAEASPDALAELLLPVFEALAAFRPPFEPVAEMRVFRTQLEAFMLAVPATRRAELLSIADRLRRFEEAHHLPHGVIHADIYPGNVLSDQSGKLWLIDFDDAHVGTRALDWVLAALEFSFDSVESDETRYRALLDALCPPFYTAEERQAEPFLRELLTLKSAAAEFALETPLANNRYLKMLTLHGPSPNLTAKR